MPVEFKNSETKDNLMRAFAGESQARNRYTFAAEQAHEAKLHVVEAVFTYTANQEKEHAEVFYEHLKELSGETIHVDGGYPVDITDDIGKLLRKQVSGFVIQVAVRMEKQFLDIIIQTFPRVYHRKIFRDAARYAIAYGFLLRRVIRHKKSRFSVRKRLQPNL